MRDAARTATTATATCGDERAPAPLLEALEPPTADDDAEAAALEGVDGEAGEP